MPGKRITAKQAEIYMQNRENGSTQPVAAAKAEISERSGRDIENGKWQPKRKSRDYKTREDQFAEVWESDIIPLLRSGIKRTTFLFEQLQKRYPGRFKRSAVRTLQRRIQTWQALHGPDKEVMFPQIHEPGQDSASDFTTLNKVVVTINHVPLDHKIYHFRLIFSGYNYAEPFKGKGESCTKLAEGFENAMYDLGGVPAYHRTDRLSAAFKNVSKALQEDQTASYEALMQHYDINPVRSNAGKANENGSVESSHNHLKNRIRDSLSLRGSTDFPSFVAYREFIKEVTREHNQRHAKNIDIERAYLRSLPEAKMGSYTEAVAVVSTTGTISIKNVTYTVPSRLIGERLHVRLYNERLECYLGTEHTITLQRNYPSSHGRRARNIDYRHVIGSLVKKPGAFWSCRYRDDLLPNEQYRYIWEHVGRTMSRHDASKLIIGLLHIAATEKCEESLATEVMMLIKEQKPLRLNELRNKFGTPKAIVPSILVSQHVLGAYNDFIPSLVGA
jgi:Mu transposase-like protein